MRRLVLNIAKVAPEKDAARGKLKKPGWSDNILLQVVRAAVRLDLPQKS